MKNFSYTKSPVLIRKIAQAEELHSKLLLTPIPVLIQQQLVFDASVERLSYLHRLLEHTPIARELIINLLSPVGKKNLKDEERQLVLYRELFDQVYLKSFALYRAISSQSILDSAARLKSSTNRKISEINLRQTEHNLQYIQTNADHPFIQAALAQLLILSDSEYTGLEIPLSFVILYQFLFSHGYDFRKMLALEQLYFRQKNTFQQQLLFCLKNDSVTDWIVFFLDILIQGSEKLIESIGTIYLKDEDIMGLSARQSSILSLIEKPHAIVTNKIVQKLCNVSPITAARDLAKLTQRGLIYATGKGRSTGYKKI